ncbi:hypothetical protein AMURIS_01218 [Acetatifactor muris]|uniref:Uncharacterized protein n=1 Tax=Acetatifactor muris TaxID=879566 RepID=A0A2K4ZDG1_9FIRM|nr:hypothetical protein AMURIS_01218 [Acetatifactor muris]
MSFLYVQGPWHLFFAKYFCPDSITDYLTEWSIHDRLSAGLLWIDQRGRKYTFRVKQDMG